MNEVHIRVLGGCEVEVGDKLVRLRHKAAELVGVLALRRSAVPRADLADLLWPEAFEADARHNLRQTLLSLRTRLGAEVIISGPEKAELSPQASVDLWDREDSLRMGLSVEQARDPRVFLPGSTGDWVLPARVDASRRIADAALRIGEQVFVANPSLALEYGRAAASREPDLEAPRGLIVRSCLALGDFACATQEVRAYEETLAGLQGRPTPSRLRAMLAPPLPLDLAGLDLGSLSPAERLRLVLAALPAFRHDLQKCRVAVEASLKDASGASPEDLARAESELANLALAIGDVVASEAHARRAMGANRVSESVRANGAVTLSRVLARMNRVDEAWEYAEWARKTAAAIGDLRTHAAALRAQGTIHLFRLATEDAERTFREAAAVAEATADPELIATIHYNLAFSLLYGGKLRAAADEIEAALEKAPSTAVALLRLGLGRMRQAQGRNREAGDSYRMATDMLRLGGDPFYLAQAVTYLGELALVQEDFEVAHRSFTEAVQIRRTIGDRLGLTTAYRGLGTVAHRTGRHSIAERHLREALRISLEIGEPMAGADVRLALARVLAEVDRTTEALSEARRARRCIVSLRAHALTPDDALSLETADALIARLASAELTGLARAS
jgi:tetratricopeptide (TPR) repeat protein